MRLPSIRALEAAEAAARCGSLAAAAVEIGMSVPALSRRIASLEETIGIQLFHRSPRGLAITREGEAYLARTAAALDQIRRAGAEAGRRRDVVRLSTVPALATRWLLPRLPRFEAANPGIEVDVRTSLAIEDLEAADLDLAIRLGTDTGEPRSILLPIWLQPVWSPSLDGAVTDPEDITRHTLLGPGHRPEFWREWLEPHGLSGEDGRVRPLDPLLLYERALHGAGVAIGIGPLVEELLEQGRLIGLAGHRVRSTRSFHLVVRRDRPASATRQLIAWLRAEAGARPRDESALNRPVVDVG